MKKYTFDNLIGQEINLYPKDTYKKRAILMEVNQYGYLFEITFAEKNSGYNIGEIIFINHACKMEMSIYKPLN
jgi:hypothetical protein